MENQKVKWGVLGTAGIAAGCTIPGMKKAKSCELYAIAGRSIDKANLFKERFGFEKAYEGYDALLSDPEVEAVYIPLPNNIHAEWVIKALNAKKHVLCEKPVAMNESELRRMFKAAKDNGVIFMEAYEYLHSPYVTALKETIKSGEIGEVDYIDTANYEPKDVAHFEYSWQWAYKKRFEDAGLTAILGCGFDPGVSGVYTAYAAKHHFDEIQYLDIVDCNAGNHHKAFATNFNPEINIREITQKGRFYENGQWVETGALEIHKPLTYPNIGPRESYLMFHEELESLVKNYPTIKRARFWMTFGQEYLTHLRVIQDIGMARIDEVEYNGVKIVPLQFLKAVLPEPSSLGEGYHGQTSIGCQIKGIKDGKERTYYVWNNCDHAECFKEVGAQAVSYTTGVPAMLCAKMILTGKWAGKGVFNVEQFDPDPFMNEIGGYGLPWNEQIDQPLPVYKHE